MADSKNDTPRSKFYALFSQYMKLCIDPAARRNEEVQELYAQLLDMVYDSQVAPDDMIRTMSEMFKLYPTRKLLLLIHMKEVASISRLNRGYLYPEFFWIVVNSGMLSPSDRLYDIIWDLSKFANRDVLRGYLTYLLLTNTDEKIRHQVIFSFYYTGHTIDSLKLVEQIIPLQEETISLYRLVYSHALRPVFRIDKLTRAEHDYLKQFFNKGLQVSDSIINENCQKALKQLEGMK